MKIGDYELNDVHVGDCLALLKALPDNSIDSIVTDPPYGISFMNKKWDYDVPSVEVWKEVLRVLKAGGHGLVACGTRTQHRMAVNLEDAGFEIRDIIAWVYGSGFPKSMDISKAIDNKLGEEREVVGEKKVKDFSLHNGSMMSKETTEEYRTESTSIDITAPTSPQAKQWSGWGTALKPSMELWTLVRKPLAEPTIAENVMKYGTGGINIDGCRVGDEHFSIDSGEYDNGNNVAFGNIKRTPKEYSGRFTANLIHDGSNEVVSLFPMENEVSASRFFYVAKASQDERDYGLYGYNEQTVDDGRTKSIDNAFQRGETPRKNIHPTVKPIELMRYLCRLITPPNGTVLDPYTGSGSTLIGAKLEEFNYLGFEIDEQYANIAKARVKAYAVQLRLF